MTKYLISFSFGKIPEEIHIQTPTDFGTFNYILNQINCFCDIDIDFHVNDNEETFMSFYGYIDDYKMLIGIINIDLEDFDATYYPDVCFLKSKILDYEILYDK